MRCMIQRKGERQTTYRGSSRRFSRARKSHVHWRSASRARSKPQACCDTGARNTHGDCRSSPRSRPGCSAFSPGSGPKVAVDRTMIQRYAPLSRRHPSVSCSFSMAHRRSGRRRATSRSTDNGPGISPPRAIACLARSWRRRNRHCDATRRRPRARTPARRSRASSSSAHGATPKQWRSPGRRHTSATAGASSSGGSSRPERRSPTSLAEA